MPRFAATILLLVALPATGAAQEVAAVRLTVDNDLFGLRGRGAPPDYDYTHGTKVSLHLRGGPFRRETASLCSGDARPRRCSTTILRLGQEIYTPREDAPEPEPGERPYAGWLYASAGSRMASPRVRHEFKVALGVTGPPSLAEHFQDLAHRASGSSPQLGWAHQVPFQPAFAATYEVRRRLRPSGMGSLRLDPHAGAVIGTRRTDLHAGIDGRTGALDSLLWPGDRDEGSPSGIHLAGGVRAERVLHDLMLEGNGGRDGRAARRIPGVTQYSVGFGYHFRRWSVSYRFVSRSREYAAQPGPHRYGSFRLTHRPVSR